MEKERRDVENVHDLNLLLLSMEHWASDTTIPTYGNTYSSPDVFLSFTTGLLYMLLPLLGTLFLWLSVRLVPTSFILQDATKVLLSPGSLSASIAEVPQHYVLTFIMALTTLSFNMFSYLYPLLDFI